MKSFNNVLIIYPEDSSIDFLKPLFEKLSKLFPKSTIDRPKYGTLHLSITDETDLIIFMGHGTTRELYGGANENGEKIKLCDIPNAARLFNGCSVVLFSCNSYDYLKNILSNPVSIDTFAVFGDMPSDWEHIKHNRTINNKFWTMCDDEQLEYYKNVLVEAVIYGFEKAVKTNSFYGFYKGVNHIVNVKINLILENDRWTKNQKLQLIDRVIEFKKEMVYADTL